MASILQSIEYLINTKFGKLTILEDLGIINDKRRVRVRCDCGVEKKIALVSIKKGRTKSCGCLQTNISDVIGKRFGRLVILKDNGIKNGRRNVQSICDCGVEKEYVLNRIKTGNTRSCGCFKEDCQTIHGVATHPLYKVWQGMINRCYNVTHKFYEYYGGRGVKVCDQWIGSPKMFFDWAIDKWEKGLELDKDKLSPEKSGKLYCPNYCCFLTSKENARLRKNTINILYNGKNKSMIEWIEELNMPYGVIAGRIRRGWGVEKAFAEPIAQKHLHKIKAE